MKRRRGLARWWVDLPLSYKGLLIVIIPLVVIVATASLRIPIARQQRETAALLARAAERREMNLALLLAMVEVESAVRGFVLTREAAFLTPYGSNRAVLTRLSQGLSPQAAQLVEARLVTAHSLVRLAQANMNFSTLEIQRLLDVGRLETAAVRAELAKFQAQADADVASSEAELTRLDASLRPMLLLVFFGGLSAALFAAWLFITGIANRIQALERNANRLARGERLRYEASRGADEIGSLDRSLRQASMMARQRDRELRHVNRRLVRNVREQELLNCELEAFSYSVSHDLRAPLRSIDGFAQALREDWGDRLDETGQDYLARVRNAAQRMGRLIDDLLKLSKLTRAQLQREDVDLSQMAGEIVNDLRRRYPGRQVTVRIGHDLHARCDPSLTRILLENLLGNAWKFTSKTTEATIELSAVPGTHPSTFIIRDNGAGFEMEYADKLFAPFQRLHNEREFPGTGIGLATSRRIVRKHDGEISAQGSPGAGATFSFTLEAADGSAVVE